MTQGEEEEGLGARVAAAGQLCPGIRSVKVTINMDTVLYCTVLYCTVLCEGHHQHGHGLRGPPPRVLVHLNKIFLGNMKHI